MIALRTKASLCVWNVLLVFGVLGLHGATTPAPSPRPPQLGPQEILSANIIIPNIDDDNGDGVPDCCGPALNSAIDNEIVRLLVKPSIAIPAGSTLQVKVREPWTRFARVFLLDPKRGEDRLFQGPVEVRSGDEAREGITIGVDVSDFADAGRPPRLGLQVLYETKEHVPLHEETITCAVAPFLVSSCLDPAAAVHVVKTALTAPFVIALRPLVEAAGAELRAFEDPALREHDIWIQDAVEIGFATDGRSVMHVALHGNRGEKLDDVFAGRFLGQGFGVVHKGNFRGDVSRWIDWFGNLEVSPPVKAAGREFKSGRIYAGTQGDRSMHPDVIQFLEAQGAQGPVLWLDTSWLIIGHVDETVSWVPSQSGSPFRMLIPSPRLAVEILAGAEKDAPGGTLNRGTKRQDDRPGDFERPLANVLADKTLMAAQEFVQKKIDGVRRTLQNGLGVDDEDVIEIPVLFSASWDRYPGRYGAETTNMVNSLLVGKTFIVPDPHGPLVNGTDVLLQAVKDRLEPLGVRVVAVDDFYPYHRYGGEVHCGTNATRRPAGGR
jgi:protein-arginine deiminase